MSQGSCLCGKIRWLISAPPRTVTHCHCSMCRKAHGAAFGTYIDIAHSDFQWLGDLETLKTFVSSSSIERAFCAHCGSVVPDFSEDGETVYVPAGSHEERLNVDAHIFVASKAPWFEITDDLPQHDEYPSEDNQQASLDKPLPEKTEGVVRGSCLCNTVQFEITEPFKFIHNCHCSRCRRARSAAFTTNGFTSIDGVTFVSGEANIKLYKLPEAKFFTHAFCQTCGSGVPRKDPDRGIAVIPLGALDDDPGVKPDDHIFVENKAIWYVITDNLPQFKKYPE